jgi:hypothetical protein
MDATLGSWARMRNGAIDGYIRDILHARTHVPPGQGHVALTLRYALILSSLWQSLPVITRRMVTALLDKQIWSAKLAELDAKGRRRQIGALDGMLRWAIARTGCSLVVLDPFVKIHALNENDNPDMDFVCSALIKIAQDCGGGFAGAHP